MTRVKASGSSNETNTLICYECELSCQTIALNITTFIHYQRRNLLSVEAYAMMFESHP